MLKKLIAQRVEKIKAMKALNAENAIFNDEVSAQYETLNNEFEALNRSIALKKSENILENTLDDDLNAVTVVKNDTQLDNMMNYVRTGAVADATNAMETGGTTKGAYLIPPSYASTILSELAKETVLRKYATVMVTKGQHTIPISGAKPVFGWIDELGAYPKSDKKFTKATLEAWKLGGIIQVSEELLNDESFGLIAHLRKEIVEGLSFQEGESFYIGDGTKKPLGLSNSIIAANKKSVATKDKVLLSEIETLFFTQSSKIRKKGTWLISDKFFQALYTLKDANDNYQWARGVDGNAPSTIMGRPYEIDDALDGTGVTALAYFGDMSAYTIGDRGQMAIQRLNELYAEDGMVGFKVYKRTDGKLVRKNDISMLKNKA